MSSQFGGPRAQILNTEEARELVFQFIGNPRSEWLEGAFLGKRVARQRGPLRALGYFYAHGRRIGSGNAGRPQHGVLREHFVIDLGYKIILAVGVIAPDLPELNGTYGHGVFLKVS